MAGAGDGYAVAVPAARVRGTLVLAAAAAVLVAPLPLLLTRLAGSAAGVGYIATWGAVGLVGLVIAAGCLAAPRGPTWPVALVLLGTSYLTTATTVVSLTGTRWGFGGLHSDAGFRTQMVTRYAESAAWSDYGYRQLPTYYPPLWPWVQGRVAAVLDVPAWTVMKPAMLVAAAVVPVLSWLVWRLVAPDLQAALVVAATTFVTADLQKADEWLALALLLPWWLHVVRGVRQPGRRTFPAWAHGLLLGLLLLTHTVYVPPLVIGTLVGWGLDLARKRPPPLGLRDTVVVAGTALLVSAPYWVPMVALRVSGRPTDSLQLRWSPRGFDVPPLPLPTSALGLVLLAALAWVLLRMRSDRLAEGLGAALLAGYTVALGGQLLQRFDIAVLPHKSHRLISAVLVAAAVSALVAICRTLLQRRPSRGRPQVATAALCGVALAVGVPLGVYHVRSWAAGDAADAARETRYPDGSHPVAGRPPSEPERDAWDVRPGDPSLTEVLAAWRRVSGRGPSEDGDTVLLTVRGDLLGTRPVHSFTSWKSIYSHPNGEFEGRVELLRALGGCPEAACAARLLTANPFDPVDGVVVRRSGDDLVIPVGVDHFPEGWDYTELRVPERLLDGPLFTREDVGTVVVAAVRRPAA